MKSPKVLFINCPLASPKTIEFLNHGLSFIPEYICKKGSCASETMSHSGEIIEKSGKKTKFFEINKKKFFEARWCIKTNIFFWKKQNSALEH